MKTLGRKDYRIIHVINRLKLPPFQEMVTIRDFTGKSDYKQKLKA